MARGKARGLKVEAVRRDICDFQGQPDRGERCAQLQKFRLCQTFQRFQSFNMQRPRPH
jgi:hypothetical protein